MTWPRCLLSEEKHLYLYADPCLTPEDLSRIINLFALDGQIIIVAEDERYRCSTCNKSDLE